MSAISQVEIIPFCYEVPNLGLRRQQAQGVGNMEYAPGGKLSVSRYAIRIETDDGLRGEYVTHWVGTPASLAQSMMLAPHLIGRDPESREQIYDDLKRELRAYDHMGHGPLDIALWDLGRQEVRRSGRPAFGRLSLASAGLCQHLITDKKTAADWIVPNAFADSRRALQGTRVSTASRFTVGTTATLCARLRIFSAFVPESATIWR